MENKGNKRQSRLDEYGAVVKKHSKLDSSVNQSDSIESILRSSDDETGDIILDSEDINKLTLKSKLSIFKLANNRLKGLENIQDDMEKFGRRIKKELIKVGMQYKGDNCDKCKPYHLMHFLRLSYFY
jgi:hypothetical protein